ncbi:MAG: ArsR/SmtB family transcription factor [Candidatus Aminicenantia bacterium]
MDLIKFLKILTDKKRVRILNLLSEREMCVCELTGVLRASQPLISHHLSVLKKAKIIKSRKIGYWTYFFLNRKGIGNLKNKILSAVLDEFRTNSLALQDLNRYNLCKSSEDKTKCFLSGYPKLCPHKKIKLNGKE